MKSIQREVFGQLDDVSDDLQLEADLDWFYYHEFSMESDLQLGDTEDDLYDEFYDSLVTRSDS